MREVLEYNIGDARLVGTRHAVDPGRAKDTRGPRSPKLGVLWVNFALASRAGHGDMAARIGDSLAARGLPVFRFDMPGLGDRHRADPLSRSVRDRTSLDLGLRG